MFAGLVKITSLKERFISSSALFSNPGHCFCFKSECCPAASYYPSHFRSEANRVSFLFIGKPHKENVCSA